MEYLDNYCDENNNHIVKENVWELTFGKDATYGYDFAGRLVHKDNYHIMHITPKSMGGKTEYDNLIACSVITSMEKANNYPVFISNKNTYIVIKNPFGNKQFRKITNNY